MPSTRWGVDVGLLSITNQHPLDAVLSYLLLLVILSSAMALDYGTLALASGDNTNHLIVKRSPMKKKPGKKPKPMKPMEKPGKKPMKGKKPQKGGKKPKKGGKKPKPSTKPN